MASPTGAITNIYFSVRTQIVACISACLADMSQGMSAHHLKLNLNKRELLFFLGKDFLIHELSINPGISAVSPLRLQIWV